MSETLAPSGSLVERQQPEKVSTSWALAPSGILLQWLRQHQVKSLCTLRLRQGQTSSTYAPFETGTAVMNNCTVSNRCRRHQSLHRLQQEQPSRTIAQIKTGAEVIKVCTFETEKPSSTYTPFETGTAVMNICTDWNRNRRHQRLHRLTSRTKYYSWIRYKRQQCLYNLAFCSRKYDWWRHKGHKKKGRTHTEQAINRRSSSQDVDLHTRWKWPGKALNRW